MLHNKKNPIRKESAEVKRLAREILTHRYGIPMGAKVVMGLITFVLSMPFSWDLTIHSSAREWTIYYVAALVISLFGAVLLAGCMKISLSMACKQQYGFGDLFYAVRNHPDQFIIAELFFTLLYLAAALPFGVLLVLCEVMGYNMGRIVLLVFTAVFMVVVMIFLSLNYGMRSYILLENPENGVLAAFRESRHMMKGKKGHLFYLHLSFLGWRVLEVLSIGIGSLWIQPYILQAQTCFYLEVSRE